MKHSMCIDDVKKLIDLSISTHGTHPAIDLLLDCLDQTVKQIVQANWELEQANATIENNNRWIAHYARLVYPDEKVVREFDDQQGWV